MDQKQTYTYLGLRTLFENNDLLEDSRENELLTNNLLVHSNKLLINFVVYRQGQIFMLWWPFESLERRKFEEEVESGCLHLQNKIEQIAISNDYLFFVTDSLELNALKIIDLINGNPLQIYQLRKLNSLPTQLLTHQLENILIFETKEGSSVLLLAEESSLEDGEMAQIFPLDPFQPENLCFVSKTRAIVYNLVFAEQGTPLENHFRLTTQQDHKKKEIYFYNLVEYEIRGERTIAKRILCSIACEKDISAADINITGEKLLISLSNGLIFVIQDIYKRGSKIYYGRQKQIENNYRLQWMAHLPVICCFGRNALLLFDNELNLLKSFKERRTPISPLSFVQGVNFFYHEELPLLSYIKENNSITLKYLTTRTEDISLIEHINISEELVNIFVETKRLHLAISLTKEKRSLNSKKIKDLELLLVTQFENIYPKFKIGAELLADYLLEALEKTKDIKRLNLLILRVVMTLIQSGNIEAAYKLAKKAEHPLGMLKVKDYCQQQGFKNLEEKTDTNLIKALKKKYELSDQTAKDLKYLKNIDSIDDLKPFDTKLKNVLQSSLEAVKNRKYENHLAVIFLITDSAEGIALDQIIKKDIFSPEQPIIYGPVNLAQVCEHFEGT